MHAVMSLHHKSWNILSAKLKAVVILHPPSSFNTHVATRVSEYLADIYTWTAVHHLKLILSKAELLFILGRDCPRMDLSVTVEDAWEPQGILGPMTKKSNLAPSVQLLSPHL